MRHRADMDHDPMAIKSLAALGERLEVKNEGDSSYGGMTGTDEAERSRVICSETDRALVVTAPVVKPEKAPRS